MTVAANEEATVDFALGPVAISLAPVVTTATGEQRRVEIGNSVAQIDAAKVVSSVVASASATSAVGFRRSRTTRS